MSMQRLIKYYYQRHDKSILFNKKYGTEMGIPKDINKTIHDKANHCEFQNHTQKNQDQLSSATHRPTIRRSRQWGNLIINSTALMFKIQLAISQAGLNFKLMFLFPNFQRWIYWSFNFEIKFFPWKFSTVFYKKRKSFHEEEMAA